MYFLSKNLVLNYRKVVFSSENGIGIRLAGGNKVGIFVCDVQYNGPAERAGLKIADKIIKVNNCDYSNLTREEAVHHILSVQNNIIEMIVAYSPEGIIIIITKHTKKNLINKNFIIKRI